jgi:transcriptional regulator with XRE-family HTH domain
MNAAPTLLLMTNANRRPLSKEEQDRASRLRAIWGLKKRTLGLTQEAFAHAMGWQNASAFGHYLHGRQAMSWEACLKIADGLDVDPEHIWPGIRQEVLARILTARELVHLAVFSALPGSAQEAVHSHAEFERVGGKARNGLPEPAPKKVA